MAAVRPRSRVGPKGFDEEVIDLTAVDQAQQIARDEQRTAKFLAVGLQPRGDVHGVAEINDLPP